MTKQLEIMQDGNTQDFYDFVGYKDSQKMQEIERLYAGFVGSVAAFANDARQNPLPEWERQEAKQDIAAGKALSDEYMGILKRLQCSIEKTCSLQKN